MIRSLSLGAVGLLLFSNCAATLNPVQKSEWVLVNSDDGKSQEIIPRDAYEVEVAQGRGRLAKFAVGEKPPVLHQTSATLTATVGEVLRFRINEGSHVELFSDEAVAQVYWDKDRTVDGWKGDQPLESRTEFVRGWVLSPFQPPPTSNRRRYSSRP